MVELLKNLNDKIKLLDIKPQISVESKEVKVEPKVEVNPTPVKIDLQEVVDNLKTLSSKINSQPNEQTNKLIADLIEKIEQIELKPEIKVNPTPITIELQEVVNELKNLTIKTNSKPNEQTNELLSEVIHKLEGLELKPEITVKQNEVKVEPVFDPHIEVKPANIKIEKTDVKTPISWLFKSLTSVLDPFLGKITAFISKVTEYIREPDKVIIDDYKITEFYGDKTVVYNIKDDGRKTEISHEP